MIERTPAINKRIDLDLLARSGAGIAVYSILFPIIFYPAGLYSTQPGISWFFTLAVWVLCVLRVVHRLQTKRFYDRAPVLWMQLFTCFSLLHGSLLGVFFALVYLDPQFQATYTVTLLIVAGMASGALSSLSPKLSLALLYPQSLLMPVIVTTFYIGDHGANIFVMLLYLGYLSVIAVVTNREYLRTFLIEAELEKQKKELETLSRVDALTGIYNRGYFNTIYEMQWDNGLRNNIGLTVMLIDVDHFKLVNDKYGHSSGDECLIQIAKILSRCLKRKTDVCSRFGGEEFAALVGGTPIHEAQKLADKLREEVEQNWVEYGDHKFKVTVSVGVANILPKMNMPSSTLIDQADQALYLAKKAGRNCVKSYRPLDF